MYTWTPLAQCQHQHVSCVQVKYHVCTITCILDTVADLEIQKGDSATGMQSAPENFWAAMPTFGHVKVRTEYLEAPLGLVKRLEISKELIRECVIVAGCCCCMPLLRNNLMDSCSYVHKNTLLAATPLNPPLR